MTIHLTAALAAAVALTVGATSSYAQSTPAKKPAATKAAPKAARKAPPKKAAPPAPIVVLPEADAEQLAAAEKVYYGNYACEFKETVDITENKKNPGYVDVKHDKADYLMKPVLSSTGAIRLEDVKGETLMVQISSKSMLLNVKTGHRIVDDCISPKQRELIETARAAKAEEAASAAASGASAPVPSMTLLQAPAPAK